MQFCGKLYRALNPIHAHEPFSGRGAELYGGRFNSKGRPALYTSTSVLTALREANQVGTLQPTTLVCYEAVIERLFDSRDEVKIKELGFRSADLGDPSWRDHAKVKGRSNSQDLAEKLIELGYQGLLVRSFAPGCSESDLNVVLWSWGKSAPSKLVLVDDEGRLTPGRGV